MPNAATRTISRIRMPFSCCTTCYGRYRRPLEPLVLMALAIGLHGLEFDVVAFELRRFGLCASGRRLFTLPFVGDRTLRVLEPAGVLVIVRRKPITDLHDGEHAAHLDRAELT